MILHADDTGMVVANGGEGAGQMGAVIAGICYGGRDLGRWQA